MINIINISNFVKKFMRIIITDIKVMMHFLKKCIMIFIAIVIIFLTLYYVFGREVKTIPTVQATTTEVSGKLDFGEEEVAKDPYFPPRIIVWSWGGGSTIKKEQLESTILAVLLKLPMVTADITMVELLQETAAIESHRGIHITQINGGPARGIFQMELRTIQDTLSWLKKNHLDQYRAVKVFWNSRQSDEWNYQKNIPWQIAMAASYYWRMAGNNAIKLALSREEREKLYKKHWNTHKGASTREKYLAMSKTYA